MSKIFRTPKEAEVAFYDAIERADIQAIADVWSLDENIVCVHPGAMRIEGRSAVLDSFAQLFNEAPNLDFSIVDTLYTGNESLAVHIVREEIALDGQLVSIMVSTNIYQQELGGWRMLLHHASPEPDSVLMDEIDDYHAFSEADLDDELDDELDDWEEPQPPPVLH